MADRASGHADLMNRHMNPQDGWGSQHPHLKARPSKLREIEITPTGLGIHFPQIDADLYLPSLLDGFLGSKMWMSRLGQRGGSAASPAKAAAARANGKLGGRPRKAAKELA